MTAAEVDQARAANDAKPGAPRSRRRGIGLPPVSKNDVIIFLLAVNLIGLVGLGIRVYRGGKPTVVTVGITQMTRDYVARLAGAPMTPEEAQIRTKLYLSVAQDAVRRAADKKGVLVLPRECVLAGEYADITPDVEKSVTATIEERAPMAPRSSSPSSAAPSANPGAAGAP